MRGTRPRGSRFFRSSSSISPISSVFAYLRARIGNLTLDGTIVGPLRCRSTLRARDLTWLYASNIVAVVATLGIAVPWVTIRMARYRASNLHLGRAAVARFVRRRCRDRRDGHGLRGRRSVRRGRFAVIAFDGVLHDGRTADVVPVHVEAAGD